MQAVQVLQVRMQQMAAEAQKQGANTRKTKSSGCGPALVVLALVAAGGVGAGVYFTQRGVLPDLATITNDLNPRAQPTLGFVDLGPQGLARIRKTGTTHGTVSVSGQFGNYDSQPTAILRVASRQLVNLVSHSREDTTLLLGLPNGIRRYDDDSGEGQDAMISLGLEPGSYPVWVGHRHEGAVYELQVDGHPIREMPNVDGLVPAGPASIDEITLTPEFTSREWTLRTENIIETQQCGSHVSPLPHLIVHNDTPRNMHIEAHAELDTTLLIYDPNGNPVCDDDSARSNDPQLDMIFPPGATSIWVGARTSSVGMATLTLAPVSADTARAPSRPARHPRRRK